MWNYYLLVFKPKAIIVAGDRTTDIPSPADAR